MGKIHSTNYFNVLIEIAEDSPVDDGQIPPLKGEKKTVARMQYEMVERSPYKYTSDDLFFEIHCERNSIEDADYEQAHINYFSKGQPCFRASPLTKKYGWGVHSNPQGKVAIYAVNSTEYLKLVNDVKNVKKKAMRSSRK